MSKHRKHNRKTKEQFSLTESFFGTILPFIDNLEKEDKILLVLPSVDATVPGDSSSGMTQGIVISSDLALSINADYLQRMADYTRLCGSLEAYYDFRQRNPKWAAGHNPDQFLLNICRSARLVIAYRYGLQLGNAEYLANESSSENGEAAPSHLGEGWGEGLPLFITMMSDESVPQSIGYELNGEVILEEYKEKKYEEVSLFLCPPTRKIKEVEEGGRKII